MHAPRPQVRAQNFQMATHIVSYVVEKGEKKSILAQTIDRYQFSFWRYRKSKFDFDPLLVIHGFRNRQRLYDQVLHGTVQDLPRAERPSGAISPEKSGKFC